MSTPPRKVYSPKDKRPNRRNGGSVYYDASKGAWTGALSQIVNGKRKRHKVSAPTKTAAWSKLDALKADLDAGTRTSASFTWQDAVDLWAKTVTGTPATIRQDLAKGNKIIAVPPLSLDKPTWETTAGDVKEALAAYAATPMGTGKYRAPRTLVMITGVLKNIAKEADLHERMKPGVYAKIRDLDTPEALGEGRPTPTMSLGEVHTLVDYARTVVRDTYAASYSIVSCLDLGPRPDEARALTWVDVHDVNEDGVQHANVLHITKGDRVNGKTKTGRIRLGTLTDMGAWALGEWKSAQAARGVDVSDSALIWPGPKGGTLTVAQSGDGFEAFAVAAGLPVRKDGTSKYTQESTRHSYVAALKRLRVPTETISNLQGDLVDGSMASTTYGTTVDAWVLHEGADALNPEFPVA